jgi:phosphate:Na+ symporter
MLKSMQADALVAFGGIGLFLLGMVLLTDGLRHLAGPALRRLLVRFTKTPFRGAAAGAFSTAIIQSSSATTVTAVGFVGAGLITFPQGLGIVFGANIGTTATGWVIALLGFKLHLGQLALPLMLAGVLLRLFGRRRLQHIGWALVGFSLLFVGIDAMQQGMAQFEGVLTPNDFPPDTLLGRMQLVVLGIVITVITQSSSAGVATALVALAAGAISFPQAAAMVIGMNVGTTITVALATIGGSTAMRQTGYAHVVFNVLTGALALAMLGPFSTFVQEWISQGGPGNAQISLAAFHTMFNTLGVILLLPFSQTFAQLIMRLVPERGPLMVQRLDERLLDDPAASIDALAATIEDITGVLVGVLADLLNVKKRVRLDETRLSAVNGALAASRNFVDQIRTDRSDPHTHQRHLECMHALDHLSRLSHRCSQEKRIQLLGSDSRLLRFSTLLYGAVKSLVDKDQWQEAGDGLDRLLKLLEEQQHLFREQTIESAAQQRIGTQDTLSRLDSIRWLHRVTLHLWRILHHLRRAMEETSTDTEGLDRQPDLDVD